MLFFFPLIVNLSSLEERCKYLAERRIINKNYNFFLIFLPKDSIKALNQDSCVAKHHTKKRESSCTSKVGRGHSLAGHQEALRWLSLAAMAEPHGIRARWGNLPAAEVIDKSGPHFLAGSRSLRSRYQ